MIVSWIITSLTMPMLLKKRCMLSERCPRRRSCGRYGRGADGVLGAELKSGIEIVTTALNLEDIFTIVRW